ncbi:uncharacterized protein PHACADRAFT_89112 [Phanerochaete carnosa HHB-10118-sp]|uniref:Uncharacterized protein n=1 Tax=Phanerochaete carnosa (strain HHB-10118-sp) TaxID=650164 RepID=K5WHP3_PHACS|nr:uncharacterized protein PHACADRAFT_89112 [Phanerochaete carnosa HHB-10118-sp]EKM58644.1 hypothetical protein PHACADRAFT_89112 [Phanerochaete carnosa HHB-10118-sp]
MFHSEASLIYADQLRNHGHGEPLWQPEPSQYGEILIGDVGFIEDGCFYRLFNCTLAAEDPVHADFGVPHGYVPLEYNKRALLQTKENYLPPKPIYSKSISQFKGEAGATAKGVSISYKFECKKREGAILVPGSDVTLSHVQANPRTREYVRLHHSSWHRFAIDQGREISPEDIVLVIGWLKTSEWAVAAVANRGKSHSISFGTEGSIASAEFGIERSEEAVASVSQRSGPKRQNLDTPAGHRRNQCLFVRYCKAKYRRFLPMKIVAGAEPRDMGDSEDLEDVCSSGDQSTQANSKWSILTFSY